MLFDGGDPAHHPLDAELDGTRSERGVQHRAPHATAHPRPEPMVGVRGTAAVADAGQRHPLRVDAQPREQRQSARHEPLPAGLVDHALARLDDRRREARESRLNRRREPDRPAARDEHVDHRESSRSARFSVGMRNPSSSTAFSTVNAIAVIHAVCTSGNAIPSIATIT